MTIEDGYFDIEGRFFAPQSSTSETVLLKVSGPNYYIKFKDRDTGFKGTDFSGDVKSLKIEPAIGSAARKIYLPGGHLFETDELEKVEELKGGGFWSGLAKTERFGWHLLPLAIATPFLAFGLYRLMIPLIISFAMFMTPDGMIKTIDKNTMKTIDFTMTKPSNLPKSRKAEIEVIFKELAKTAQEQSDKTRRIPEYKLLFRSGNMGPNAFALPGGTIVMTDDLVYMFPKEDKEDYVLSAVLAHEIGHVEHEHSLRQLYRALGMAAMIGLIAGDAGPVLEDIVLEGSALLALSFSRKHEMQADDFSYDILSGSGQRADGLIRFFEKLGKDIPMPESGEWMMTHPLSSKRIDNIKAHIDADKATKE